MEARPVGPQSRDLITMLDDLKHRGVKFHSLTEAIDTETPTGRAIGADDWRTG
jgi:DNA invertase Pin-like site-specific DNA recombinase